MLSLKVMIFQLIKVITNNWIFKKAKKIMIPVFKLKIIQKSKKKIEKALEIVDKEKRFILIC